MNKILAIIPALLLVAGACSDDEAVKPSDLPENDLNISVPDVPADWAPGMAYKPYDDNLPEAKGVEVNVVVVNEGRDGELEMGVLNNDYWIWQFQSYGADVVQEKNKRAGFFPNHEDIHVRMTESRGNFNPGGGKCDIVVLGFPVEDLLEAKANMDRLLNQFDEYPLVIAAAGETYTPFSMDAWKLCLRMGGLDWKKHVLPAFPEWGDVNTSKLTDEQKVYYHPGNVGAAYAVQNVGSHGHAKDWIVVGCTGKTGNRPGEILKDRWICAPYEFNVGDTRIVSTALSAAYVAKIAAEIKRRLPDYTNEQIAGLIFQTGGLANPSEMDGYGTINPKAIWGMVSEIESEADADE